jgi:hypothetical protein
MAWATKSPNSEKSPDARKMVAAGKSWDMKSCQNVEKNGSATGRWEVAQE